MFNKRMIISLFLGALLGIVCVIGASIRSTSALSASYLFAFWFNRFLMGFVFGLMTIHLKIEYIIIRGIIVGLLVSFAFYSATNFSDLIGFLVGTLYGVIIELVLYYSEKRKSHVQKN